MCHWVDVVSVAVCCLIGFFVGVGIGAVWIERKLYGKEEEEETQAGQA